MAKLPSLTVGLLTLSNEGDLYANLYCFTEMDC